LADDVERADAEGNAVRAEQLRAEMEPLLHALSPHKKAPAAPKKGKPVALSPEEIEVRAAALETAAQIMRDKRREIEELFIGRLQERLEARARDIVGDFEERFR
jgi:hypothetical protein